MRPRDVGQDGLRRRRRALPALDAAHARPLRRRKEVRLPLVRLPGAEQAAQVAQVAEALALVDDARRRGGRPRRGEDADGARHRAVLEEEVEELRVVALLEEDLLSVPVCCEVESLRLVCTGRLRVTVRPQVKWGLLVPLAWVEELEPISESSLLPLPLGST